ncbi:MAG: PHP domain-containing protein [Mogibacterium sp.]|nr:PHP domain-containing protein [Mogibacterium sp.]
MNVKIDLHMHTTVSDGTDTPEEILQKVKEAGIGLFSVTDHDAVKGCGIIREVLAEGDPAFVNGVEFSCRDDEGKYHILGYGYDPAAPSMRKLISASHRMRMKKIRGRLEELRDRFGFTFPEDEIKQLLALDNPGKPHIANLMVKYGYTETKEEAIKKFINQVRFPDLFLLPEEAIRGVLEGGGIPVLAHPFYGSGDELILGDEMDERLRKLLGYGLQGVEVFYSGFTTKLRNEMLGLAERYDLYVTAGSDYHGGNKLVILGDTGLTDPADMPAGMQRFLNDIRKE